MIRQYVTVLLKLYSAVYSKYCVHLYMLYVLVLLLLLLILLHIDVPITINKCFRSFTAIGQWRLETYIILAYGTRTRHVQQVRCKQPSSSKRRPRTWRLEAVKFKHCCNELWTYGIWFNYSQRNAHWRMGSPITTFWIIQI